MDDDAEDLFADETDGDDDLNFDDELDLDMDLDLDDAELEAMYKAMEEFHEFGAEDDEENVEPDE